MIVRIKHDSQNPYVILNKKSLWDPDLSLEAIGLWARLLSRPDDWEISAQELATSCGLPIRRIHRILNELIDAGYCERLQEIQKGKKDFGKVEYHVFESKKIKEILAHVGLASCATASCATASDAKCHTTNTESTNKEETKSVCIGGGVPTRISKNSGDGVLEIALSDFINISLKKDWELKEVNEAWGILASYEGIVRDPMAFMAGTIKNIRKRKQHKYLNENNICQKKSKNELPSDKSTTSEETTEEPVSLGYLLGMTDRKWL